MRNFREGSVCCPFDDDILCSFSESCYEMCFVAAEYINKKNNQSKENNKTKNEVS